MADKQRMMEKSRTMEARDAKSLIKKIEQMTQKDKAAEFARKEKLCNNQKDLFKQIEERQK